MISQEIDFINRFDLTCIRNKTELRSPWLVACYSLNNVRFKVFELDFVLPKHAHNQAQVKVYWKSYGYAHIYQEF